MVAYTVWRDSFDRDDDIHCIAQCLSWEAKQAVLRLLFGSSLVLPPNVQVWAERELPEGKTSYEHVYGDNK